jgi:hypothetical protein
VHREESARRNAGPAAGVTRTTPYSSPPAMTYAHQRR